MRSLLRPIQAGFTLVELLIVVIIIAVLAAIVVPQFSSATLDAQEAALDANLASLRSAIELYRAQHSNKYPGATATSGGTGCAAPGVKGLATTGDTNQAFYEHMTMASDGNGNTCSISDPAIYRYGPYMRKMPSDSITVPAKGSLVADILVTAPSTGAPLVTGTAPTQTCSSCGTTGGWRYDTLSGQIVMNNSTLKDSKTNFYFTH